MKLRVEMEGGPALRVREPPENYGLACTRVTSAPQAYRADALAGCKYSSDTLRAHHAHRCKWARAHREQAGCRVCAAAGTQSSRRVSSRPSSRCTLSTRAARAV